MTSHQPPAPGGETLPVPIDRRQCTWFPQCEVEQSTIRTPLPVRAARLPCRDANIGLTPVWEDALAYFACASEQKLAKAGFPVARQPRRTHATRLVLPGPPADLAQLLLQ